MPTDSSAADRRRILLRMAEGRDRELLTEWLAEERGHAPVVAESNETLEGSFDACIVDAESVADAGAQILARRRQESTFLPCLLLIPERMADDGGVMSRLPGDVADAVDETVTTPIRKRTLGRRLETLIRMRELSERLASSRDRYHRLLEVMPETVVVVEEGVVDYVNESGIELLGDDEPAIVGSAIETYVDPGDHGRLDRHLRRIRGGHRPGFVELTLTPADECEELRVQVGGVRVFDESGELSVQLVVRRTVSENGADSRLEVLDRVLRTTFKTRLNAILEATDEAESEIGPTAGVGPTDLEDAPDQRALDRIDDVREAAESLLELSTDAHHLRTVLRQDAVADAACDVVPLVEEAAEAVEQRNEVATVETSIDPGAAYVHPRECVDLLITEVIEERLADDGGGSVALTTVGDGDTVQITIDGAGEPDRRRWVPLVDSEATVEDSDDVGLWLARWAIDQCGGEASIGESGTGGSLVIRLPAADENGADLGTI